MPSDSTVTVLVKSFVAGLLAVTVVSTYLIGRGSGPVAAVPGLLGVYIALTLAGGVFVTGLLDVRFQVAFALGIAAFGASLYLADRALVGVLLAVVGLFTLGTRGRELVG